MSEREKYIHNPTLQLQEKILTSIISKDESICIFDIGACEGENSIRYARLFPKATIYTFEPLPSNFDLVIQNKEKYRVENMHPISSCLSNTIGETTFHLSSGNPDDKEMKDWNFGNKSSSILPPEKTLEVHPWLKFEKTIKVPTTTLIDFCKQHAISTVDYIHMDVQGAELMVLQGAGDFINQIKMIWLEVEAEELYKGQPLEKDIANFMLQHHFVKIEDTVYTTAGDQFWVQRDFIINKKSKWYLAKQQAFISFKKSYKKFRRTILK
ncbi:MAG: FkbM family methyltransferase [Chitinophagales bacterium]